MGDVVMGDKKVTFYLQPCLEPWPLERRLNGWFPLGFPLRTKGTSPNNDVWLTFCNATVISRKGLVGTGMKSRVFWAQAFAHVVCF